MSFPPCCSSDEESLLKRRLPPWLKVPLPAGPNYRNVQRLLDEASLHTVCQEAHCPNAGDCWEHGTATFLILGSICTRGCRYCAVAQGTPKSLDLDEPERVAEVAGKLGLHYVVVTSVTRDDLPDGGASMFARTILAVRHRLADCKVEVLVPDFGGSEGALRFVLDAQPDVLNHNIEVARSLFSEVRPRGDYGISLGLLSNAKRLCANCVTKSGFMVGLGETWDEVLTTMRDLRRVGCDLLTIGQYLSPSNAHHPVARFYKPEEFEVLRQEAQSLGFTGVVAAPLVRSSYHAGEQHALLRHV